MKLIRGALLVDGSGGKPYNGDVLIDGDTIAEIAPHIAATENMQKIEAAGRVVCPGFIDAHRHCDFAALYDPDFGELELAQGITTVVAGNCGLSPAPAPLREAENEMKALLSPCLGDVPAAAPAFAHAEDYVLALRSRRLPVNMGVLCATGAVTAAVKGVSARGFTRAEMKKAKSEIKNAMEAGALGLSCGIMYVPECYTTQAEFAQLCGVAKPYGGYLTAHVRNEGSRLAQSIQEVISVAKKAEIPLNISHFKVTGLRNWGEGLNRAIDVIEKEIAAGFPITVDAYPYTAGSTTALSLVPPEVLAGRDIGFLSSAQGRALFKAQINQQAGEWENMVEAIGWARTVISSAPKTPKYSGMDFAAAAEAAGEEIADFFCRILVENAGQVGVIVNSMAQADVDRVLELPYCSLISDALYGAAQFPHPRLYGAFPKFIRKYVCEEKRMPMEAAVAKMTAMPAKRLGLGDRGLLRKGMKADIVLFSPDRLADKADFQQPKQLAEGIDFVLINGKIPGSSSGEYIERKI